MIAPPSAATTERVQANAWHALGGVWRLTRGRTFSSGRLLAMTVLPVLLAVLSLASVRTGAADQYFGWMAEFYLSVVVPVLAFLSGAGAIRDEMKSGAVEYVLTRPVRRPVFVVFKYLAQLACLQIAWLPAFAVMIGVGLYRGIPGVLAHAPAILLGQVMALAAFSALGFLAGVLSGRYLILGLTYAGIVEAGIGQIPTSVNRLSMTHHVRTVLAGSLGEPTALLPASAAIAQATLVLATFAVVVVALAALAFAMRELAGSEPKDA